MSKRKSIYLVAVLFAIAVALLATVPLTAQPSPDSVLIQITAASLTVRSAPSPAASAIGQVKRNNKIILSGISSDAKWYYFLYYDKPAWIVSDPTYSRLLSGDIATLPVIDSEIPPAEATSEPTEAPAIDTTDADLRDAQFIADSLDILAGGRNILTVHVLDGRSNGGERGVVIAYAPIESSSVGLVTEVLDILSAVAAAIRAHNIDLDSFTLIISDRDGNTLGFVTGYIPDLMAWRNGKISGDEFASRLTIINTSNSAIPTTAPVFSSSGGSGSGACSPCPRNCTAAVAMGCTAVQAAACGLDRDKDGVACYGD